MLLSHSCYAVFWYFIPRRYVTYWFYLSKMGVTYVTVEASIITKDKINHKFVVDYALVSTFQVANHLRYIYIASAQMEEKTRFFLN